MTLMRDTKKSTRVQIETTIGWPEQPILIALLDRIEALEATVGEAEIQRSARLTPQPKTEE